MTKAITCMKIYLLNQKWHFSSPEPKANRLAYMILMVRRPSSSSSVRRRRSQCSKIFSSETAGPIKAKMYVEPPWVGGTKFYSRHSGSHDQDGSHAHIW